MVSWGAPANVAAGGLWVPSLRYCAQRWSWGPAGVVADRGSWAAGAQQPCREPGPVAVVTQWRADMQRVPPFVAGNQAACAPGQPLEWLGSGARQDRPWFGGNAPAPLCPWGWPAAPCPRPFAYAPSEHETLLGWLPLSPPAAPRLWQPGRPWIEPAPSFAKHQWGLSQMFLHSWRLTWWVRLLADAAGLLRALALLRHPPRRERLHALLPHPTVMDLEELVATEPQ